jgi:hypothetical protein
MRIHSIAVKHMIVLAYCHIQVRPLSYHIRYWAAFGAKDDITMTLKQMILWYDRYFVMLLVVILVVLS